MVTRVSTQCKIYIGPANEVAADATAYDALTFTAIGQILNLGEFGDSANPITAEYLEDGRTQKYKGTRDAGTMALEFGYDYGDTGQAALIAAEPNPGNFAFKVELNDSGGTNPTTFYFRGQVMSHRISVGSSNSVVTLSADVAVNSPIVRKDAA